MPSFLLLPILVMTMLLGGRAAAEVTVTEFLASNRGVLPDEDGDFSDWIEVHNPTPKVVDLKGWTLTDDPMRPTQWVFPSTNLPPGGFLVVFASGKDRSLPGRPLHTGFSLSSDGEYLALFPPDSKNPTFETIPPFPRQRPDVSFGTLAGRWLFFTPPSPGATNSGGFIDRVADTKFSHDRGFYEKPFDLVIGTQTQDALIRFTTNGTPPSLLNGFDYTGPIPVRGTTVIRAAAFRDGYQSSGIDTHTYLFLSDVIRQAANGATPPGWPSSWGSNSRDYGMDPDVVDSPIYRDRIIPALRSLPSFSVVTDQRHLFDPATGIYANPGQDGRDWERPISLELIHPDGTKGFQVGAGIRIRGGFSRNPANPKHALRFFFREEYGVGKLRYPVFGSGGSEEFDSFDLRTFQNYSWSFQGDRRGVFIRDQFSRDTQLDMGHQGERGDYVHLYINGMYWGLYNTCERPEASYSATYYGGSVEDWDVIKVEAGPYTLNATDGDLGAWTRLYEAARAGLGEDAAYFRLQGRNVDGTPNSRYENLVDVDNLIDYILVILYAGNLDAPISNFLGNTSPNNWYGQRNRTGLNGGFRFTSHDAEHTLLDVNANRTGPFGTATSWSLAKSNPQYLWQQLSANGEFRLRVADHVHRHFFNGGALTPESSRARFGIRTNQIHEAVIAESARWGDAKTARPLGPQDWLNAVSEIMGPYFERRTEIVLNQLRAKSLYPAVDAPVLSRKSGVLPKGFVLTIGAPAGQILYTLDGTDPRSIGGLVSAAARTLSNPGEVRLTEGTLVRARVLLDGVWSALSEAEFQVVQDFRSLAVTELMYHPLGEDGLDGDRFEFVELKNTGSEELDLAGLRFTAGIGFRFPRGSLLAPGAFAVLVSDPITFRRRYPGIDVTGVYQGRFSNTGERVVLADAEGNPIVDLEYAESLPWPVMAGGRGFSIVPSTFQTSPNPGDPTRWRGSARPGGSPGQDDPVPDLPAVVVNEVLASPLSGQSPAVEIHNPTSGLVDISGWFLSDSLADPKKYQFAAGSVIPAGGYLVVTASDFDAPMVARRVHLDPFGGSVWLSSADPRGVLTGYGDGFLFPASAPGESQGLHWTASGTRLVVPQSATTLGSANRGPRIGPVIISEFNPRPAVGEVEFVELRNLSDAPIPLFDPAIPAHRWRLSGVDFEFPPGVVIPPQGLVVITAGDPTRFRNVWGIPSGVPVLGPFLGNLQDGGERIRIERPGTPEWTPDSTGESVLRVPFVEVDSVRYDFTPRWPVSETATGITFLRRSPTLPGDDPAAWRASFPGGSPGQDNGANRPPIVDAGPDRDVQGDLFPMEIPVTGSALDDGVTPGPLRYRWLQISGPAGVSFSTPDAVNPVVRVPGPGVFGIRFTVDDGDVSSSDEMSIRVSRTLESVTLLPLGSVWRYLDTGTDQGSAWRGVGFDDSAWPRGKAELGYGDGDEASVVGFGPTASSKYITTYFRSQFEVRDLASIQSLRLGIVRDDGPVVYLNGVEVYRNNLPETDITFQTPATSAIGGADEDALLEAVIDGGALREGANVIAVEMHQNGGGSSDLSFNLQLTALRQPANRPPSVDAGSDRTVQFGESMMVVGGFSDDGLPAPPGVPKFQWSTVSGPGDLRFTPIDSPQTQVTAGLPGVYRVRFEVDDGQFKAVDEFVLTVSGAPLQAPDLMVIPGGSPLLRFNVAAGVAYRLRACEVLGSEWLSVLEVAPGAVDRTIEWPLLGNGSQRFFQVVTLPAPGQ